MANYFRKSLKIYIIDYILVILLTYDNIKNNITIMNIVEVTSQQLILILKQRKLLQTI